MELTNTWHMSDRPDHHFGNRAATTRLEDLMEHMSINVEWKCVFDSSLCVMRRSHKRENQVTDWLRCVGWDGWQIELPEAR